MAEGDIESGIGQVTDRVASDFNNATAPGAVEYEQSGDGYVDEYDDEYDEGQGIYEDPAWDSEEPQESPEGYGSSYDPSMTVNEALATPEAAAYFEQEAQQQAMQQEAQEVLSAEAAEAGFHALAADALREARVPTEGAGAIPASTAGDVLRLMIEQRAMEHIANGLTIEQAHQVMYEENAVGQELAAIGEEAKRASVQQTLNTEFLKFFPNAQNNDGRVV